MPSPGNADNVPTMTPQAAPAAQQPSPPENSDQAAAADRSEAAKTPALTTVISATTSSSTVSATTSSPASVENSMPAASALSLEAPSKAVYDGGTPEGGAIAKSQRNVIPQKALANQTAELSNTVPEESDFRRVIGDGISGELARFLDDKLRLLVWSRATSDAPIVFGAQLDEAKVIDALKTSFQIPELTPDTSYGKRDYCVAILDDTGKPVAQSDPFTAPDWKRPFVSTEIGEALPHWEAALYITNPARLGQAARTLRITIALIVLILITAIIAGGSLIAADVRRQVRLAQQKTDFVSNVSHELKTPLTSIRMFADLLAEKRVPDEERQSAYLRIIAAEAARLTRLINNVLDFARLEKGKPPGERHACDLVDIVRDVTETCAPHLEAESIAFRLEIEADTLPIRADRDALAQIILNLVSNAEKYGGRDILVRVRQQETPGHGALGCVDVLDRGPGIPPKDVKTIFEPFHRLDDSLASGVPGSGLGLTLARRMARAHGGDVTYSARSGGGSCFTLTVPLENGAA
jgi:signal transduction histidine kinase